jgi:DNA-binding transcriptional ArsR family regulator
MDALKSAVQILEKQVAALGSDKTDDVLRGSTREVYRFLLKSGKPAGTREIQRALNLSSPSLASYHLAKLEEAGLLKKENGNYVIDKVVLEDCVKVSRFFVPRFLFYAVFAVLLLTIELTLFRPSVVTSFYFFATAGTLVCAIAFCYETARVWFKDRF